MTNDDWRPIADAPRDGTQLLVAALNDRDTYYQRVAWWDDRFENVGWDEEADDPAYRGAWTAGEVRSFAYEEYDELDPTHWRPLPAPPVQS